MATQTKAQSYHPFPLSWFAGKPLPGKGSRVTVHQHSVAIVSRQTQPRCQYEQGGNCHDNAVAESFFHLLKRERIRRRTYTTRDAARQDVFNYIEMFYNPTRKHTNNGRLSPVDYEMKQQKMNEAGV